MCTMLQYLLPVDDDNRAGVQVSAAKHYVTLVIDQTPLNQFSRSAEGLGNHGRGGVELDKSNDCIDICHCHTVDEDHISLIPVHKQFF